MSRRVVLDCDTGSDDAVAIMLAALADTLDLLAVTAVWGNQTLAHTTDNALRVLDHVGRADVAVFAGCAAPIAAPAPVPPSPEPATLPVPATERPADSRGAVEWLVDLARTTTDLFTLVPTGPLSTIATVLQAESALVEAVDQVVLMGGVVAPGDRLPPVETNVGHDPAAARIVLAAPWQRLVMVPLDTTYRATLGPDDCTRLRAVGTRAGTLAANLVERRIQRYRHQPALAGCAAAPVHDALPVAMLLDPAVVTLLPATVDVQVGRDRHGQLDVTFAPTDPAPTLEVAVDVDRGRFVDLLVGGLE